MGGIARKNNIKALAIGGTDDHAHLLVSIPAVISAAKAVQLIKGGSSKWIKEAVNNMNDFSWQEGYGAFSVSLSFIDKTIRYIEQQEEHHRRRSFQEEYLEFLDKHGIEYDDRYVWG
jgi:REP element-mobilizing transposase RayT